MKRRFRIALAIYTLMIFTTLPLLPQVAEGLRNRLGADAFSSVVVAALAAAGLIPFARLRDAPPATRGRLAGYLLLLLAGGAVLGATLASSPVGRIHLVEYAVLGFLAVRSLPDGTGGRAPYVPGWAAASLTGLLDETVQHFLPNRVFDWYDVALNSGAALLGVLCSAWWERAGQFRGRNASGGLQRPADCE